MLLFVLLVPIFGSICAFIIGVFFSTENNQQKGNLLEMSIERNNPEDEFFIEQRRDTQGIVPVEEALLINNSSTKRSLMMAVLNDEPKQYAAMLSKARMNNDVEVVHYATTALAAISSEYDLQLQNFEREYKKNPQNVKMLQAYSNFLKKYLKSDFIEKNIYEIQQQQYINLLQSLVEVKKDDFKLYLDLIDTFLELKDYNQALHYLNSIEEKWGTTQEFWMEKLKYYFFQHNYQQILETVAEIKKKNIYLSGANKELVKYWMSKKNEENKDE
ncbi:hypothetical protein FD46_GL001643 [Liquorilactobacillus oeni DSM 19972]|uniref:Uncharacterized protein n=2 Tax=Liquorilactobacillus oeni TaxID=303241 RepID=A0A0R1M8J3_9LACO|nr:hypothetical protein FD46_GL001643 [Liquorilactobacillus oeni DSM 19972]